MPTGAFHPYLMFASKPDYPKLIALTNALAYFVIDVDIRHSLKPKNMKWSLFLVL
jgi:hypothetical protein